MFKLIKNIKLRASDYTIKKSDQITIVGIVYNISFDNKKCNYYYEKSKLLTKYGNTNKKVARLTTKLIFYDILIDLIRYD